MKVFIAGSTGAVGKSLVPLLVRNGHDVVGDNARAKAELVGSRPFRRGGEASSKG